MLHEMVVRQTTQCRFRKEKAAHHDGWSTGACVLGGQGCPPVRQLAVAKVAHLLSPAVNGWWKVAGHLEQVCRIYVGEDTLAAQESLRCFLRQATASYRQQPPILLPLVSCVLFLMVHSALPCACTLELPPGQAPAGTICMSCVVSCQLRCRRAHFKQICGSQQP